MLLLIGMMLMMLMLRTTAAGSTAAESGRLGERHACELVVGLKIDSGKQEEGSISSFIRIFGPSKDFEKFVRISASTRNQKTVANVGLVMGLENRVRVANRIIHHGSTLFRDTVEVP
jgi:hypothetical protein